MKKNTSNLILLYMIFGVSLVIANVVAPKLFATGVTLFGRNIALTAGIVVYPITFLITDVVSELFGRTEANRVVKFGFITQIVASTYLIVADILPAISPDVQSAYTTMLGLNWLITIGSLTAYTISQTADVFTFHRIRTYLIKKGASTNMRWLWNNASTMTSQLIDSTVFVSIVCGIGFGWFANPEFGVARVITQILAQYTFKLLIALVDTPVFWLLTRKTTNEVLPDTLVGEVV